MKRRVQKVRGGREEIDPWVSIYMPIEIKEVAKNTL
jgi:hypothetical protein